MAWIFCSLDIPLTRTVRSMSCIGSLIVNTLSPRLPVSLPSADAKSTRTVDPVLAVAAMCSLYRGHNSSGEHFANGRRGTAISRCLCLADTGKVAAPKHNSTTTLTYTPGDICMTATRLTADGQGVASSLLEVATRASSKDTELFLLEKKVIW